MEASNTIWEPVNKKYKLINRIGSGVYGLVFEAEHIRTKKRVAIKMVEVNTKI